MRIAHLSDHKDHHPLTTLSCAHREILGPQGSAHELLGNASRGPRSRAGSGSVSCWIGLGRLRGLVVVLSTEGDRTITVHVAQRQDTGHMVDADAAIVGTSARCALADSLCGPSRPVRWHFSQRAESWAGLMVKIAGHARQGFPTVPRDWDKGVPRAYDESLPRLGQSGESADIRVSPVSCAAAIERAPRRRLSATPWSVFSTWRKEVERIVFPRWLGETA